ncbi:TIR domain-containing protein [Tistrella mobilis]|uniref:TIR domain-containing protein n=1 Tax=Tistrella mobilis TaxID=171437 RepID=UPI0035584D2A
MVANLLDITSRIRRRIFVSYHHGGDQVYYDEFSRQFHDIHEIVTDNSLERPIDSNNPEYVMRRIRENHIQGTSCTIVLVGRETHARKYVDWEIKATLDKRHGLIGIQLPTAWGAACMPDRLADNVNSGYAVYGTWAEITASAAACQNMIEAANARDKQLIANTRPLRQRNG